MRASGWRASSQPACMRPGRAIATKPTRGAKQRRLDAKRGRSTIKRGRTQRDWD